MRQSQERDAARTYVATRGTRVVGYYTLAYGAVEAGNRAGQGKFPCKAVRVALHGMRGGPLAMAFRRFCLGCLAHASYFMADGGQAAVVDPQRDINASPRWRRQWRA